MKNVKIKTILKNVSLFMAFALILGVAHTARAQYTDSMGYGGWNNPMSSLASTMIWSKIWYRTPNGKQSTSTPPQATGPATRPSSQSSPQKLDERSVKFKPSGTYLRTAYLADQLGNTPDEREQYRKLMNASIDAFDQQARKAGLQNDMALALSYFLGENLRIYRGEPDLTDQQFISLRNAIADALVSTGALQTASDRQKQEFYEALVAYTGITQYGYEEGLKVGNRQIAQGYQKVAAQNLQTVTKMSPDKY